MLNSGGFLITVFLPWVMFAPVLPLSIILFRRIFYNPPAIALVLFCVVTLLMNGFLFIIRDYKELQGTFLNISTLLEFIFSALILRTCTTHKILKYAMVVAVMVYVSVLLTFDIASGFSQHRAFTGSVGYALLFIFSLLVLLSQQQNLSRHLIDLPVFWFAAGIFFQSGLVSFLLLLNHDVQANQLAASSDFGVLFIIIVIIKFIFFSAGALVHKNS
jgi:hypothetical protein